MISLPLENNIDFGAPNGTAYVLHVQPVIPFNVGDWNLITRTIVPIASVKGQVGGLPGLPAGEADGDGDGDGKSDREWGVGDTNHTTFVSPAEPGAIIWGIGPSINLRTATDDQLGSGKWSAGPSAVLIAQPEPWSLALLVRQLWSFAGDSDRKSVNQFVIQPFINYNLDDGWYLSSEPAFSANWDAKSGQRWTVPVGGGFGRLLTIGEQPINFRAQAFYNVEKPDIGPDWALRISFAFLFPK